MLGVRGEIMRQFLLHGIMVLLIAACQSSQKRSHLVPIEPPVFEGEILPLQEPVNVRMKEIGHSRFQVSRTIVDEQQTQQYEFEGLVSIEEYKKDVFFNRHSLSKVVVDGKTSRIDFKVTLVLNPEASLQDLSFHGFSENEMSFSQKHTYRNSISPILLTFPALGFEQDKEYSNQLENGVRNIDFGYVLKGRANYNGSEVLVFAVTALKEVDGIKGAGFALLDIGGANWVRTELALNYWREGRLIKTFRHSARYDLEM